MIIINLEGYYSLHMDVHTVQQIGSQDQWIVQNA